MSDPRMLVVDDSIFVREGVAAVLRSGGFDVVGELGDATGVVEEVERSQADGIVLDIRMPPTHTIEGIRAAIELRGVRPGYPVLLLSQHVETTYLGDLLQTGADGLGYLLKDRVLDTADFTAAVRRVLQGGSALDPEIVNRLMARSQMRSPLDRLTRREREVLALMAEGLTNAAISERLSIGARTLESHIAAIFTKLDLLVDTDVLHRRVAAVVAWLHRDG